MKYSNPLHTILLLFLFIINVNANNSEPVSPDLEFVSFEEVNLGISKQLNSLITFNEKQQPGKKWYIYFVGEKNIDINNIDDYLVNQLDLEGIDSEVKPVDVETLNQKLIDANTKLKAAGKPLIYYGIANKRKAIPAPFFPFENYHISSASNTELIEYYKKAFDNPLEESATSSTSTYDILKALFAKSGEASTGKGEILQQTLDKSGGKNVIALSNYYFAFIKDKKNESGKASISWWSMSSRTKGSDVAEIDNDILKAHYRSLSSSTGDKNTKRVNAWFNYLTEAELPDSEVLKEIYAAILNNSKCNGLSVEDGNTQKTNFINAVNAGNREEIIRVTRTLCSVIVKEIDYNYINQAIKIIAKSSIEEKAEAVVLYLLHNIRSTDYPKLFAEFKNDDDKLLRTLLSEMDDRSINPLDGDNYTSFIGALLYIGTQDQGAYLKKERAYLLEVMLMAEKDFEWDKTPIAKAITDILTFNLDPGDSQFYNYLTDNKYDNLYDILQFLTWSQVPQKDEYFIEVGDALGAFFAQVGDNAVYIELLEVAFNNKQAPFFVDAIKRLRIAELAFRMFANVPENATDIYAYLTKDDLEHLKNIIDKTSENDYRTYADSFYEGLTKILDAEHDINTRIALAKWAIEDDSILDYSHENMIVNIFRNIERPEDRQTIYNFLTYKGGILGNGIKDYEYFNKITADGVLSGNDLQVEFINYYVSLIKEGFGEVKDRIAIIERAVEKGDDWGWFWFSDTEDVISTMFNGLTPGDAEAMVGALKGNGNYQLFKNVWEMLQSKTWPQTFDRDNERFANFVIGLSKVLELSKQEIGWEIDKYKPYLDEEQKYLSSTPSSINTINTNYLPICRANFFDQTNGQNSYNLQAEVNEGTGKVHINLQIGGKQILNKDFNPFEYIFVEFVEDTEINTLASFKKGDVIAVPAFYIAWLDGSIGSEQASVTARVTMDGVVIVLSAVAIAGSGGALTPAVMAAGAEIFFAGTDAAIAIYKDELDAALGSDFSNTLEIANMAWGIINLPSALQNLPKGLVKIRRGTGQLVDLTRGMTLSAAEKLSGVVVDTKVFIAALPDILNQLKNNPATKAQLFKKVSDLESSLRTKLAGLGNPSQEFRTLYEATKDMAVQFYHDKMPVAFGTIVNNLVENGGLQQKIVNKFLVYSFEGKTILKLSPEGILKEIKIYSVPDNYTTIVGDFKASVKVASGKVYEETIEVIKKYNGEPIFRPKFAKGTVRDADLVNELHIRSKNSPPYMNGTQVEDIIIEPGKKFYVVEYLNKQDTPGGFGSNKPISSIEELRQELAVLEDWKNPAVDDIVVREYQALQPIKTRSGAIGPQPEISGVNAGQTYPGGGHQYEFLDNWRATAPTEYMKVVKVTKLAEAGRTLWKSADEMRTSVINWAENYSKSIISQRQINRFNKATVASYKKADGTIEIVHGRNGGVLNTETSYPTISAQKELGLHPDLADKLPETTKWPNTANCAECDAVNQALHNGAKWDDIQIHTIKRTESGDWVDVIRCDECQDIFKGMHVTSE